MKLLKNEFVVLVSLFALIVAVGAAVLLYPKKNQPSQVPPVQFTKPIQEDNFTTAKSEVNEEELAAERISKELATERTLDENLYSILMPEGWVRAVIQSNKFLALVIKPEGQIDPSNLADVDYDTYYAVNNTKMETSSLDEYVDMLKQSLSKQIPSIEFTKQNYGTINGHNAVYLESASTIDGKNYRTLLTFVADETWVWAISFNTLTNSWEANSDVFYRVSNSLVIK